MERLKVSTDGIVGEDCNGTGVADEQLERIEQDRKRASFTYDANNGTGKRSRSISSYSSTSVSTVSTNLSRSSSPRQAMSHKASQVHDTAHGITRYRGRRSQDSSMSYSSDESHKRQRRGRSVRGTQYLPEKLGSVRDGRGKNSDKKRPEDVVISKRKRRRSRSSSMSHSSDSSSSGRRRSGIFDSGRRTRPRRSTVSPDIRGRDRWSHAPRSSRRTQSRSNSMDRSQIARERRSMTPVHVSREGETEPARAQRAQKAVLNPRLSRDDDRYGSSFRTKEHEDRRFERPRPVPPPRKERSLSPFSKRVALTQAMNMGR
ncbi:MAG: hypothetical protein Q9180_003972 [Flavoplaca navasiana]